MRDILVAGETLVDFIPDAPGSLAGVESFSRRAGGAPANVAVGLARLDATPGFWTRVGDDAFGEFLVDTLAAAGLPTDRVEQDPSAQTTLAFVSHGDDAEREFSFYRDGTADTRLLPGAVGDGALADADWVHVGGVTLATGRSREATYDLMERAADAGATVSFDPNARTELWTDHDFAESVHEAFALADVVKATPADLEAAGITGDADAIARTVCAAGPHTALVTLGGAGSYAYATADAPWAGDEGGGAGETGDESEADGVGEAIERRHGGYEIDPVDTTGAGDAFTAGAVRALWDGEGLAEALAFGNAVAATATTAEGAMTALPTLAEVEAFRSER